MDLRLDEGINLMALGCTVPPKRTYLVFVQVIGKAPDKDFVRRVGYHGTDHACGHADGVLGHTRHRLVIVRPANL